MVIEKLKQKIVKDLNWGEPLDWTHSKYEFLAENIYEKTKVQLGTNTLKRFFGKIASKSLPGKTTKDALAQFAGYNSYIEFYIEKAGKEKKKKNPNRNYFLITVTVVVLVTILLLIIPTIKNSVGKYNASGTLWVKDTIGIVPFTQTFYYQTKGIKDDSLQIRPRGKDKMSVAVKDSVQNHIHFVPGRRQVDLLYGDKTLSTVSYNVITPGWLLIYPVNENSPRHYIPIDTVKKGFLQVSKQELERAKITVTDKEPMLSYLFFRDFHLDGNDFTFSTRIKNPKSIDEKMCQDAVIMIHTDTSGYYLYITQKGCEIYNKFYFGEKKLDGASTELDQLSLNLDDWQDIKIVSKPGYCELFINNKKVISEPFHMPLGRVNGIFFQFRGSGMVDEIEVLNSDGLAAYKQSFGD